MTGTVMISKENESKNLKKKEKEKFSDYWEINRQYKVPIT